MPRADRGRGQRNCIIALLTSVTICLLWTSAQLALQPPCATESRPLGDTSCHAEKLELDRMRKALTELQVQKRDAVSGAGAGAAKTAAAGAAPPAGLQISIQEWEEFVKLRAENEKLKIEVANLNEKASALAHGPAVVPQMSAATVAAPGAGLAAGGPPITKAHMQAMASQGAIGVAMVVCRRPHYLEKAMKSVLSARYDSTKFPIVISQDGDDQSMASLVESKYVRTGLAYHVRHEHEKTALAVARRFGGGVRALGYVHIAQHSGFVLRTMFDDLTFQHAIFIEEDLEVAPDFFSFFQTMLHILHTDPTTYCVSAWNDNGVNGLVADPKAVFRAEIFPGLGWMVTSAFWKEVSSRWPSAYWDEFMRRPDVRKARTCIRPEISRTYTFGADGTSGGQFFTGYLSKIKLNKEAVDWANMDVKFLETASAFEQYLRSQLASAAKVTLQSVDRYDNTGKTLRLEYDDKKTYHQVANKFGLMPDEKEGIRRTAYRGIVVFAWRGNRILLHTSAWPGGLQ